MRIVLLGHRGMLGSDLEAAAAGRGVDVVGCDLPEFDVTRDLSALDGAGKADWVVNCAAFTDVDAAETAPERAHAVNAEGTVRIARRCAARGVPLLQLSTDYVFDGTARRPYREDDPVHPLNVYGASKLAGERAVVEACDRFLIVRTQSLFGWNGRNFVKAIRGRVERGDDPIEVVADQVSCPTYTAHLADAILRLLRAGRAGIVHVSASGACSWYEFAQAIAAKLGAEARMVPVASSGHVRPARRPAYSVLDNGRFREWTGWEMPSWREGLDAYLAEDRTRE